MGTLRFFEEVVSFKIRRTFGFADYTAQQAARANSVNIFFIVQLIYWLNIFESLEVLKWEKRPPEQMGSSLR